MYKLIDGKAQDVRQEKKNDHKNPADPRRTPDEGHPLPYRGEGFRDGASGNRDKGTEGKPRGFHPEGVGAFR